MIVSGFVLSYSKNEMGWALFWDLDPLLQYLHLDKYLLQQYIQSNYEGLKISLCICILGKLCFPGGSDGKASAYNAGDRGSISGSERSPGEGNGNPLQYSCLEKSHGWRSLVGCSPWGRWVGHDWATSLSLSFTFTKVFNQISLHLK